MHSEDRVSPDDFDRFLEIPSRDREPKKKRSPRRSHDESESEFEVEVVGEAERDRQGTEGLGDAKPETEPKFDTTGLSDEVAEIIAGLRKSPGSADAAFRALSFIDPTLIPECLDLVTSRVATELRRVRILVVDKNFVQDRKLFLASNIKGMGLLENFDENGRPTRLDYTKKSYNVTRDGKAYVVVIDKLDGFSLGVAVRAALLNRIQSRRFPSGIDHRRHLRAWWRAYYGNVVRAIERQRS